MAERAPHRPEAVTKDPFLAALEAAEWDDEPYTDEERAAVEEGHAAYRRGDYITLENILHRPGMTGG